MLPKNEKGQFGVRSGDPGHTLLGQCLVLLAMLGTATDAVSADNSPGLRSQSLSDETVIERLAFGSCFKTQRQDDRAFAALTEWSPQLFVFAGDTLYPDEDDRDAALPNLRRAYAALAANEAFAALRAKTEVLPVWDDHDFGANDAGADFPFRRESERLFLRNWGVEAADPRARRPGLYFSRSFGPPGRRLQIIVLDTRYFRSPLRPSDQRGARGRERYIPDSDPGKTLLGEAQWSWLAQRLSEEADLRLIVSSIQVLADGHGWEGWRQLPRERERLYALLRYTEHTPTLLLSGDRHVAGFYRTDVGGDRPLLEFTSSALNNTIPPEYRRNTLAEAGPNRIGDLYGEGNFGGLLIDWERGEVSLGLYTADGRELRRERLSLR